MEKIGIRAQCVTVLINGPEDADPWGREALLLGGKKVGRLTSGGYSVHFGKQIGMSDSYIKEIQEKMMSGDYENLIQVFDNEFG